MIIRLVFVSVAAVLAGCASEPSRARSSDPAAQDRPGVASRKKEGLAPARLDDFEVGLRELTMACRRHLDHDLLPYVESGTDGCTVTLALTIWDMSHRRYYRVSEESRIAEVVDQSGKNLLDVATGPTSLHAWSGSARQWGEFISPLELRKASQDKRSTASCETFDLDLHVPTMPTSLSRVSGALYVDVATNETEVRLPGTASDSWTELCPGIKARVLSIDARSEGGPPRTYPIEFVCDETAPHEAGVSVWPPVIASGELIDDKGELMAHLIETMVRAYGKKIYREYSVYQNYSYKGGRWGEPKTLRIHLVTQLKRVEIPFSWGPLNFVE